MINSEVVKIQEEICWASFRGKLSTELTCREILLNDPSISKLDKLQSLARTAELLIFEESYQRGFKTYCKWFEILTDRSASSILDTDLQSVIAFIKVADMQCERGYVKRALKYLETNLSQLTNDLNKVILIVDCYNLVNKSNLYTLTSNELIDFVSFIENQLESLAISRDVLNIQFAAALTKAELLKRNGNVEDSINLLLDIYKNTKYVGLLNNYSHFTDWVNSFSNSLIELDGAKNRSFVYKKYLSEKFDLDAMFIPSFQYLKLFISNNGNIILSDINLCNTLEMSLKNTIGPELGSKILNKFNVKIDNHSILDEADQVLAYFHNLMESLTDSNGILRLGNDEQHTFKESLNLINNILINSLETEITKATELDQYSVLNILKIRPVLKAICRFANGYNSREEFDAEFQLLKYAIDWGGNLLARELLSSMEKDIYNYKHLFSTSELNRRQFYLLLASGIIELNQDPNKNESLAVKYLEQVEKYYNSIPGSINFKDYLTYKYWYTIMKYRSYGVLELSESIKKDIEQIKQNNQNTSKYYREYLRNLWNSFRHVDAQLKVYLRTEIRNLLK